MVQRITRWVLLVVVVGLVSPLAPTAASVQDATEYRDPEGRFSVPVPAGWTAEQADGYGVLTDPDGEIVVSVLALDGRDLEAAIAEAWRIVEPAFAMPPLEVLHIPPPLPGTEEGLVITYDIGDLTGDVIQAFAVLADGVSYVMLIRADPIAVEKRASQFNVIVSGFTITGVEEVSLAGARPQPFEGELVDELDAIIVETMELLGVPGATVAIVQDGEVVYRQAFGVTELGGGVPMTPETRMMIGSSTKPLTTMMLATLVDEGVIAWDTPVVDILPWFAVADEELTPRITVQDLVCACTGVPRRDIEFLFNADELTAEDIVASLAGFEFFTPIGEAFQYSNQMVAAAGYVGGVSVHGEDADLYEAYVAEMQARVLDPIGMTSSTFSIDAIVAGGGYATPHGATLDGEYVPIALEMERWAELTAPSGGLWSNVDDMSRYLMTVLAGGIAPDGTTVVSSENLRHTWEPQVPVTADVSYGLGWFVESYKGQTLMHHGGNTLGFTSDLAFLPDAGIGIVVLSNGQATTLFNVAVRYRLLELVFGLEPEIEAEVAAILEGTAEEPAIETGAPVPMGTPGATPAGEPGAVDPAAVQPFLGEWVNEALGPITLELEDGTLYLDAGEFRTSLRAVPNLLGIEGRAVYLTADPPLAGLPVDLRTSDAGETTIVIGEGTYTYPFTRAGAPAATPMASPAAAAQLKEVA